MSPKADRPDTTLPTRRALLAGAPAVAAAALAAGGAVNILAMAAARPSEADPIFAVIRAHHDAMAHEVACLKTISQLDAVLPHSQSAWHFNYWEGGERPPQGCADAPEWIEAQQGIGEAYALREDAIEALLTTEPKTLAGAIALLEYVGSPEYPEDRNAREPILFGVVENSDDRFPDVVWAFPARLAQTMRNLIGEVRS